ncbi:4-hydroxybenzoate octaprenyltransferase [Streptomyces sp. FXJ1.4098]|nr:4-hydroxybenzoate octaprenyltransferase [Streptomyces sp. FXJ1.4098]
MPGWIALGAIAGPRDGGLLGLLLLVYGVLSRGAACGLNDVLDARFDAQVPRTAGRPVASGRLAAGRALVLCVVVGAAAPLVMGFWSVEAVVWAAAGVPLAAVYPYLKRVTHWPHVWLGITMNWAVPLVYVLLAGGLGDGGWVLYGALICWAVGTDVIYACQDQEADVRAGVRSAAVLLGRRSRVLVGGVYAGCVVLLAWFGVVAGLGPLYWPGLCVVAGQLGWQVWRADPADVGACGRAFGTNPCADCSSSWPCSPGGSVPSAEGHGPWSAGGTAGTDRGGTHGDHARRDLKLERYSGRPAIPDCSGSRRGTRCGGCTGRPPGCSPAGSPRSCSSRCIRWPWRGSTSTPTSAPIRSDG